MGQRHQTRATQSKGCKELVTGGKPDVRFARRAINSYLAEARLDDGSAWGDTHTNLGRALDLAPGIRDATRVTEAVKATIDYVERTAEENKVGTYCYLFDNLLPPTGGPELEETDERRIVELFEAAFFKMTTPGSDWDVEPHSTESIGRRLVWYYQRKGKPGERSRLLGTAAEISLRPDVVYYLLTRP